MHHYQSLSLVTLPRLKTKRRFADHSHLSNERATRDREYGNCITDTLAATSNSPRLPILTSSLLILLRLLHLVSHQGTPCSDAALALPCCSLSLRMALRAKLLTLMKGRRAVVGLKRDDDDDSGLLGGTAL